MEPGVRGGRHPQRHPGAGRTGRLAVERRGRAVQHRTLDGQQPVHLCDRPVRRRSPHGGDSQRRHPHHRVLDPGVAGRIPRVRGAAGDDPRGVPRGLAAAGGPERRSLAAALLVRDAAPGDARRERRDRSRRPRAAGIHRPGAERAGDARSGAYARTAARLPRHRRHPHGQAVRSGVHGDARHVGVGHGLQPAGHRPGPQQAGGLLLAHHRDLRPLGHQIRIRHGRRGHTRRRARRSPRYGRPGVRSRSRVRDRRGRRVRRVRPRSHGDAVRPDVRSARLGQGPRDARESVVRFPGNAPRSGGRRLPQAAARLPGPVVRALVRDARHHQVPGGRLHVARSPR